MSENNARTVTGPPPRRSEPSRLLKKNRGAEEVPTEEPAIDPVDAEEIAPAEAARVETAPAEAVAPAETAQTTTTSDGGVVHEAATSTASSVSSKELLDTMDPLKNVTFRVRASRKAAFNAAFMAAQYHEGWGSAEELFQHLLEQEIKRIQNKHNNGQPFAPRGKGLPRGRGFTS